MINFINFTETNCHRFQIYAYEMLYIWKKITNNQSNYITFNNFLNVNATTMVTFNYTKKAFKSFEFCKKFFDIITNCMITLGINDNSYSARKHITKAYCVRKRWNINNLKLLLKSLLIIFIVILLLALNIIVFFWFEKFLVRYGPLVLLDQIDFAWKSFIIACFGTEEEVSRQHHLAFPTESTSRRIRNESSNLLSYSTHSHYTTYIYYFKTAEPVCWWQLIN